MEDLKRLLVISKDANESEVTKVFELLANRLLGEYYIIKGDKYYRLLEIEFYFNNEFHKDKSVYKRTISAGKWYIHLSGVDISFESDCQTIPSYFGGILIRSVQNMQDNLIINGPLCCLIELFQDIDINGGAENIPRIEKHKTEFVTIGAICRFGIKSNLKYCYYNTSSAIKWKSGYKANPLKRN